tara:strand:- start:3589 stop:3726 length:138 start_codon:yes stop_codon:yes gene_type:complete
MSDNRKILKEIAINNAISYWTENKKGNYSKEYCKEQIKYFENLRP